MNEGSSNHVGFLCSRNKFLLRKNEKEDRYL